MSSCFFIPCVFKYSVGERREQESECWKWSRRAGMIAVILGTGGIWRITLAWVCSHSTFFHFSKCKQPSLKHRSNTTTDVFFLHGTPLLTLQARLHVSLCLNQSNSVVMSWPTTLVRSSAAGEHRTTEYGVVPPSWIWTWAPGGATRHQGADLDDDWCHEPLISTAWPGRCQMIPRTG